MRTVFISYSSKDRDFAERLATDLRASGAGVWFDQWEIKVGDSIAQKINDGIHDNDYLAVVLSPDSVASAWVRKELNVAMMKELNRRSVVVLPILYRDCKIPSLIADKRYADFRKSYEAGFSEVVRVLAPEPMERRQPFEPEMVLMPAGEFLMGSDPSVDKYAEDNEQPQHTLYLPDYYLAKTPVTNTQYAAFVQATGHQQPEHWKGGQPPRGNGDHPVVWVTWRDAVAYCRWLAEVTGRPYGLPSEAEWEKGARGSDGRLYPWGNRWGNRWDAERCNSYEGGKEDTMPVGAYPEGVSPYGLLDMGGNVWEWTRSLWGEDWEEPSFKYPYDPADGREDLDAPDTVHRVLRGGAFYLSARSVRCACRGVVPSSSDWARGFRIVLVAPGFPSGL
jgi:formylglycine-generating enzyme required for sulfatase activity